MMVLAGESYTLQLLGGMKVGYKQRCRVFKFMGYNSAISFDIRKKKDFLVFMSGTNKLTTYHHIIKIWEKVALDDKKI
jgi:hypothetical protein